jgi:hypothetical protein
LRRSNFSAIGFDCNRFAFNRLHMPSHPVEQRQLTPPCVP